MKLYGNGFTVYILGSVLDNLLKNFEDVDVLEKAKTGESAQVATSLEKETDICCKHFKVIYANLFFYVEYCSRVILIAPSNNSTRGKFL